MRRVVVGLTAAMSVLVAPGVAAGAADPPAIDGAVQVTAATNPFRAFASPVVAVDPGNQQNIVVAYGEARSSTCGVQFSTNAGLSWTEGASPLPNDVAACVRNTNGPIADLAFTPDGTLLHAFAGYPKANDFRSRIYVARSTDLGRTFSATAVPGLDPPYPDDMFGTPALPTVAVDPTNPKRVYVAFQANYGLFSLAGSVFPPGKFSSSYPLRAYVARSDDGGATFGQPVAVSNDPKDHASRAYLAVGKDGEIYVFAGEVNTPVPFGSTNPPAAPRIFMSTSTDGGRTFTQKVIHTSAAGSPGDEYAVLLAISPAVDPKTGDVYLTWEDTGRRPPEILFSRSSDKGATWSAPRKINDVAPSRQWDFNEMEPAVSVAPNGRIDLAWLDYRKDYTFSPGPQAQNAFQDVYMASSSDGGETWSANMRVTDRSIDRRLSDVWSTGVHSAVGLHALNTGAYVAWDDTRNATADSKAQDVYFTRVRLEAAPPLGGSWSSTSTGTKVAWGLGGAALALSLAGGALFAGRGRLSGSQARGTAVSR
ncbi:MAG TPA: sialidase family protein [Acidimicrobiales bacterium]|nr:sialidase family protein [Acidimicrobiales bacterium]